MVDLGAQTVALGQIPRQIGAADVEGDGDADLLVAWDGDDAVVLYESEVACGSDIFIARFAR